VLVAAGIVALYVALVLPPLVADITGPAAVPLAILRPVIYESTLASAL